MDQQSNRNAVAAPVRAATQLSRELVDVLPVGVCTFDRDGRVAQYNRCAAAVWGLSPRPGDPNPVLSGLLRVYTADGEPLSAAETPTASAIATHGPVRDRELIVERQDGSRITVLINVEPLFDPDGSFAGAVACFQDISERKDAEANQKALLHELNHRVKNNMQLLNSLLRAAQRETPNTEAQAILSEAGRRVGAVAAAQQIMYEGEKLHRFGAQRFLDAVCANARFTGRRVDFQLQAEGDLANDVAMPLALILNELIDIAVKHGIKSAGGKLHDTISVALIHADDSVILSVEDDNPPALPEEDRRRSSGLGLVASLAQQIGGSLDIIRGVGTRCTIRFPAR